MTAPPNPWPRLAAFPSLNGRIVVTLVLIAGTGLTVLITRFLDHAWSTPADAWLGFLLLSAGLDTTHFYLKRKTAFAPNGQKTEEMTEP